MCHFLATLFPCVLLVSHLTYQYLCLWALCCTTSGSWGGAELRIVATALSLMPWPSLSPGDAVAPGSLGRALLRLRQRLLARQSETPLQVIGTGTGSGTGTGHCSHPCTPHTQLLPQGWGPEQGCAAQGTEQLLLLSSVHAGRYFKATFGVCSTPAKTDSTFLSSNWILRQFRLIQNRALSS